MAHITFFYLQDGDLYLLDTLVGVVLDGDVDGDLVAMVVKLLVQRRLQLELAWNKIASEGTNCCF